MCVRVWKRCRAGKCELSVVTVCLSAEWRADYTAGEEQLQIFTLSSPRERYFHSKNGLVCLGLLRLWNISDHRKLSLILRRKSFTVANALIHFLLSVSQDFTQTLRTQLHFFFTQLCWVRLMRNEITWPKRTAVGHLIKAEKTTLMMHRRNITEKDSFAVWRVDTAGKTLCKRWYQKFRHLAKCFVYSFVYSQNSTQNERYSQNIFSTK